MKKRNKANGELSTSCKFWQNDLIVLNLAWDPFSFFGPMAHLIVPFLAIEIARNFPSPPPSPPFFWRHYQSHRPTGICPQRDVCPLERKMHSGFFFSLPLFRAMLDETGVRTKNARRDDAAPRPSRKPGAVPFLEVPMTPRVGTRRIISPAVFQEMRWGQRGTGQTPNTQAPYREN